MPKQKAEAADASLPEPSTQAGLSLYVANAVKPSSRSSGSCGGDCMLHVMQKWGGGVALMRSFVALSILLNTALDAIRFLFLAVEQAFTFCAVCVRSLYPK